MSQDGKSSGDELIESLIDEHEHRMLRSNYKLSEAKLRLYTIQNRILWVCLTAVSVINLILFWSIYRHLTACPLF